MCTVLLPPGVNPTAVNKYINMSISMSIPGPTVLLHRIHRTLRHAPSTRRSYDENATRCTHWINCSSSCRVTTGLAWPVNTP